MQTSDENKEKYQLYDYQILQTNMMKIIWQIVRRITNVILGVKGLKYSQVPLFYSFQLIC